MAASPQRPHRLWRQVIDGTSMTGPSGKRGGQLVEGDQALVVKANSVSGKRGAAARPADPGHRADPAERGLRGRLRPRAAAALPPGPAGRGPAARLRGHPRPGGALQRPLLPQRRARSTPGWPSWRRRASWSAPTRAARRCTRSPSRPRGGPGPPVDLADLEQDLDHSVRELAKEVRQRVHGSATDLRAELRRPPSRPGDRHACREPHDQPWPAGGSGPGSGVR